jgi:hypothetical protein
MRWQVARPAVSDPSWYGPSGYRVAYLSGHQLRVIAGDGTGDHLLAGDVTHVAPVWRSGHPYQLAYVDGHGVIVVRDADSGHVLWRTRARSVRTLQWSENGDRLLALTPTAARIYGGTGHLLAKAKAPPYVRLLQGSLSPNGRSLALVRGGMTQDVAVVDLASSGPAARSVLSGAGISQVMWAPDNHWLLVSWQAADQWVFLRVGGSPRVAAVSHINQQFGAGSSRSGSTRPQAPKLEGWCCTASGSPG